MIVNERRKEEAVRKVLYAKHNSKKEKVSRGSALAVGNEERKKARK